jgi:hypothetical protein
MDDLGRRRRGPGIEEQMGFWNMVVARAFGRWWLPTCTHTDQEKEFKRCEEQETH